MCVYVYVCVCVCARACGRERKGEGLEGGAGERAGRSKIGRPSCVLPQGVPQGQTGRSKKVGRERASRGVRKEGGRRKGVKK